MLGADVGTVTYALIVLKTVRTGEDGGSAFTPIIGANLAIVFAVVDLLLLVVFLGNLISFARPHHFIGSTVKTAATSLDAVLAPHHHDWLEPLPADDRREGTPIGPSASESDRGNGGPNYSRCYEVKATEIGVVVGFGWDDLLDALVDLRQGHPTRAEVVRMRDAFLKDLLRSPAIVERPELWSVLDHARERTAT